MSVTDCQTPVTDYQMSVTDCQMPHEYRVTTDDRAMLIPSSSTRSSHPDIKVSHCWMVCQHIGYLFALHNINGAHRWRMIPSRCLKAYAQSLCSGEVLKCGQAAKSSIVDASREVYTITDDSLPSHMRSLLPSHEQHVHDLLTLERTRRRLRYVIITLTILLALTVLVAVTLVFSLKVKTGAEILEGSRFREPSLTASDRQISEAATEVKIALLNDRPDLRHKWTVYRHSGVQQRRTPCVTECWSYAAFRFRSVCQDGYCRCHGENYDTYTCLPKYHNCHIEKRTASKAVAKLFGRNQTTYSCQLPSPDGNSVHVISIFGNHRAATTHVTVKNQSPSRKILVLVNYHLVKWTVHLPKQSGISKVYIVSLKRLSQANRVIFKGSAAEPEVEVVHKLSLTGYGEDKNGGHTPQLLRFIEQEVGPVTSFLGASHADEIFLDLNDSQSLTTLSTTTTKAGELTAVQ